MYARLVVETVNVSSRLINERLLNPALSWQDTWCWRRWASRSSATSPPRSARTPSWWGWWSTTARSSTSTTSAPSRGSTWVKATVRLFTTQRLTEQIWPRRCCFVSSWLNGARSTCWLEEVPVTTCPWSTLWGKDSLVRCLQTCSRCF